MVLHCCQKLCSKCVSGTAASWRGGEAWRDENGGLLDAISFRVDSCCSMIDWWSLRRSLLDSIKVVIIWCCWTMMDCYSLLWFPARVNRIVSKLDAGTCWLYMVDESWLDSLSLPMVSCWWWRDVMCQSSWGKRSWDWWYLVPLQNKRGRFRNVSDYSFLILNF